MPSRLTQMGRDKQTDLVVEALVPKGVWIQAVGTTASPTPHRTALHGRLALSFAREHH
jgi:hypothetical protein